MGSVTFPFDTEKFFAKCVKHKILPKNNFEKQAILLRLVKDFENDMVYSEQEVNEKIREYFEDYTTLRRELINFGYMRRDSLKGEYWVVKRELNQEDIKNNSVLKKDAKPYGVF